jgi:hypothetical protein
VINVFAAAAAKFAEFKSLGRRLFVLCRCVIPALAGRALQHNIIAWHN